jgi:hypothetical protein
MRAELLSLLSPSSHWNSPSYFPEEIKNIEAEECDSHSGGLGKGGVSWRAGARVEGLG